MKTYDCLFQGLFPRQKSPKLPKCRIIQRNWISANFFGLSGRFLKSVDLYKIKLNK